MKNKIVLILLLSLFLYSCSGFKLKRSQNSEEFLIEKKNPLVMPPDINDLPKPNSELSSESENNLEKILNKKAKKVENLTENENSSLKDSILKKIEE